MNKPRQNPSENVPAEVPQVQGKPERFPVLEVGKPVTLVLDNVTAQDLPSRIRLGKSASVMLAGAILALVTPFEDWDPLAVEEPGPPEGGPVWPFAQRRQDIQALVTGKVIGEYKITEHPLSLRKGEIDGFYGEFVVETAGHQIDISRFMPDGETLKRHCEAIQSAGELRAFGWLSVDFVSPHDVALFADWWEPVVREGCGNA